MRVAVLGMMGRCPFGGQTWLYLNWLLGLSRLGHDVWYVEDDSVWPYDPVQNTVTSDCTYAVKHVSKCMERIGLADKWAFRLADRRGGCWGICESGLDDLYGSCDVLLNVVGATDLREKQLAAPRRIYLETDPVVAELRLAEGDKHTQEAFANHDLIATYGENFGNPDCRVPLNGLDSKYRRTRQPIDLENWPMCYDEDASYFTTIGNYRQTAEDVEYKGDIYYWSKHREWEKFIDLPGRIKQAFEVALKIDESADQERLASFGWRVISPVKMSLDVFGAYQQYFRKSRAEFTVAKDQNVRLRSGWFSERDACYLATGKPVVAQDTGFGNVLPTGEGLFAFKTMDDILGAIDSINTNYCRHCEAARAIAEQYFDAEKVAAKLLADIGM